MQSPLQISFRNLDRSMAVEANVREKVEKLDKLFKEIITCRVSVEALHKHHNKGNLYHVRIYITVPDGELVVSRRPDLHHAHEDIYVAVRDAFNAARRQLRDYFRRRKGHLKTHEMPPQGKISQLFLEKGYGWITTPGGRQIFFHENSVLNHSFNELEIGTNVQFHEEKGDHGPQASTVRVMGKYQI